MEERRIDYWREAQGGFRGSRLLMAGAALLALGALLSLAGLWLNGGGADPRAGVVVTGWLAYIFGLALVGLGLSWTCAAAILPRLGLTAAALHLAQAAYLLFILFARTQPPVSPVVLTVGRLLSLVVFAAMAFPALGRWSAPALGAAAGLGLAKTVLRVLTPRADGGTTLDALLLLALAAAWVLVARRLRQLEDDWARRHRPGRRSDFSEFNNPQHDWNRPAGPPDREFHGATR